MNTQPDTTGPKRKSYHAPRLAIYGEVSGLTQTAPANNKLSDSGSQTGIYASVVLS
jgi:hypothetical protein